MVKESEPRLLAEAAVLGVVGALAAQCFTYALRICEHFFLNWIAGYQPPGLPAEGGVLKQVIGPHGLWLIPGATTIGGLISGFLVYTFASEAEGHGTDTVVKAFHRTGGFIRARVAPLKLVASAITIGSGGAAGREGPTALIGAGVGSIYATISHRHDEERRVLILMGMAAGLSAIFRSPIGAAFFAVEVLYGNMEFETGALLYTMLASVVAYGVNGLFVGWQPLFYFPPSVVPLQPLRYVWFGVLGCASGLVATLLPVVFYRLRDAFRALPFPAAINPAIGGLGVGLLALKFPQILGGGYGWIQEAINGQIAVKLLLVLIFLKNHRFCTDRFVGRFRRSLCTDPFCRSDAWRFHVLLASSAVSDFRYRWHGRGLWGGRPSSHCGPGNGHGNDGGIPITSRSRLRRSAQLSGAVPCPRDQEIFTCNWGGSGCPLRIRCARSY